MALSELGHHEEALARTEEAVKHYRELAKNNPAYLLNLSNALNNIGFFYNSSGRPALVLPPLLEAVKISREWSNDQGHLSVLGDSLTNLGISYGQMGRWKESLTSTD